MTGAAFAQLGLLAALLALTVPPPAAISQPSTAASAIGFSVSAASRRQLDARRARSDAQTLAAMAAAMASRDPLGTLVTQLRTATGATGVAVVRQEGPGWKTITSSGTPPATPDAATTTAALGPDTVMVIGGAAVQSLDAAVFESFTAHLADALERDRLDEEVRRADRLAEVDRLRTSLLGSVSHDLRTPLTAIKAASSTLDQPGASWPPEPSCAPRSTRRPTA